MIFDVIVLAILIIPMVLGLTRGFVSMFLRTMGWIVSLIAGFFLARPLADFLADGFLGTIMAESLSRKLTGSVPAVDAAVEGLPGIISGGLTASAANVSALFVDLLMSTLISILSFLVIIGVVRFCWRFLVRGISRRRELGIFEGADKALGLVVGLVQGLILTFLFLAALVLIVNFFWTGLSEVIVAGLENSVFAKTLYDNNLLLLITGGFFS
ncbi:MAG: CvpA family protein [Bacillota bacterium]|nr:CvpA family protein [Bacillota bacterium]